jgi:hypothetical protein
VTQSNVALCSERTRTESVNLRQDPQDSKPPSGMVVRIDDALHTDLVYLLLHKALHGTCQMWDVVKRIGIKLRHTVLLQNAILVQHFLGDLNIYVSWVT